jgi:hypothetical protein
MPVKQKIALQRKVRAGEIVCEAKFAPEYGLSSNASDF